MKDGIGLIIRSGFFAYSELIKNRYIFGVTGTLKDMS